MLFLFWRAKGYEPWHWDTAFCFVFFVYIILYTGTQLVEPSNKVTTPNCLSPAVHGFIASSSSAPPARQPHPTPHHQKVKLHLPHDGNVLSSYEELQCKYLMSKD